MRKLDLILEDIRDEYMINLLEEGSFNELETLKTKKFLNENLNRIRKMLIEEGALEGVKQHLGDNWGKYLAGAGTGAAMANGVRATNERLPLGLDMGDMASNIADEAMNGDAVDAAGAAVGAPPALAAIGVADAVNQGAQGIAQAGEFVKDAAGNILDGAGNIVGNIADYAQDAMG